MNGALRSGLRAGGRASSTAFRCSSNVSASAAASNGVRRQRRFLGVSGVGWGVLGVVGAGAVGYRMRLGKNKALKKEDVSQVEEVRQLSLDEIRKHGVVLYRYLTCPFCGKVKAFLDQHKIPYVCVEVDPLTKSQMKGLNYGKVPFMQVKTASGELLSLADSYDIVSILSEKVGASAAIETPEAKEWREWGSEKFIRYVTLNLNRSVSDAWNSAAYIDVAEEIPAVNRFLSKFFGSITMYIIVQHAITKPKLVKMGYDGGDARQALYAETNHWVKEGLAGRPFYGGSAPNGVDTDIYGIINAIRGLPLYMDVLRNTEAREWIHRMDKVCGNEIIAV